MGVGLRRAAAGSGVGEGRWALLSEPASEPASEGARAERDELAEAVAWQLLMRWGVVAWELWSREPFRLAWREVVRALRRLEARGLALGGRFVAGLAGEQYALPEAAELLAKTRAAPHDGALITLAAADPLNLTGTVLAGPRVPAVRRRTVTYRDGLALVGEEPSAEHGGVAAREIRAR
jgi:ATP-dependent Lhr-like helicase